MRGEGWYGNYEKCPRVEKLYYEKMLKKSALMTKQLLNLIGFERFSLTAFLIKLVGRVIVEDIL